MGIGNVINNTVVKTIKEINYDTDIKPYIDKIQSIKDGQVALTVDEMNKLKQNMNKLKEYINDPNKNVQQDQMKMYNNMCQEIVYKLGDLNNILDTVSIEIVEGTKKANEVYDDIVNQALDPDTYLKLKENVENVVNDIVEEVKKVDYNKLSEDSILFLNNQIESVSQPMRKISKSMGGLYTSFIDDIKNSNEQQRIFQQKNDKQKKEYQYFGEMDKETSTIEPIELSRLNYIGLPPLYDNDDVITFGNRTLEVGKLQNLYLQETMMMCYVYPMAMNSFENINNVSFRLDKDTFEQYYNQSVGHIEVDSKNNITGYSRSEGCLRMMQTVENSYTDVFSNQFGNTFLESMTDILPEQIRDFMQMTGSQTVLGGVGNLQNSALQDLKDANVNGAVSDVVSNLLNMASNTAQGLNGGINGLRNSQNPISQMVGNTLNLINNGGRIDFPKVWKSSTQTFTYPLIVRLYCENPNNDDDYYRDIVSPLAQFLTLQLPRQKDQIQTAYMYPFFAKIVIPGEINTIGAISSLSVMKGGDSMGFSTSQRPYLVDMQLQFESLYDVMITKLEDNPDDNLNLQTTSRYLKQLWSVKKVTSKGFMHDNESYKNDKADVYNIPASVGMGAKRGTQLLPNS